MASSFTLEQTVNLTAPDGATGARFVPWTDGRVHWFKQDLRPGFEGPEELISKLRHSEVVRILCHLDQTGWV